MRAPRRSCWRGVAKQAGRLFDAVAAYIRRNPEPASQVHAREYVVDLARVDGGDRILRMANDPSTLYGYQPPVVVVDELFAWTKPNHRRAWAALTTAGGSRRSTQVLCISTAGSAHERETSILGRLIDGNEQAGDLEETAGLTVSRNHPARTLIFNYSAPTSDPHDIGAMKLANPASWIDETYEEPLSGGFALVGVERSGERGGSFGEVSVVGR